MFWNIERFICFRLAFNFIDDVGFFFFVTFFWFISVMVRGYKYTLSVDILFSLSSYDLFDINVKRYQDLFGLFLEGSLFQVGVCEFFCVFIFLVWKLIFMNFEMGVGLIIFLGLNFWEVRIGESCGQKGLFVSYGLRLRIMW